jgi:hypothetical protein
LATSHPRRHQLRIFAYASPFVFTADAATGKTTVIRKLSNLASRAFLSPFKTLILLLPCLIQTVLHSSGTAFQQPLITQAQANRGQKSDFWHPEPRSYAQSHGYNDIRTANCVRTKRKAPSLVSLSRHIHRRDTLSRESFKNISVNILSSSNVSLLWVFFPDSFRPISFCESSVAKS